ncbi:MAG: hypothetical protein QOJ33_582 [Chloroflexota bacterium]|jgi:hypothetical protein|nr:hypothetical protein [Chloroflexota bacterium]MEA2667648.1 hypothetical protein [Chloroflexota bacterium]
MLPISGVIQRRLLAAGIASALALAPLSVAAAASSEVDALWNQPDGVSVDSAYYVVQTWWDGLTRATQSDPTQRGLDELAQANTDLLNAYTLLQRQRTDPGPQPVAIIDPLLSSVYNAVTGSNVKAPIGSMFNWANQSLLKLEGRGSTSEIVGNLLQDYRAKQAAAMRDLPSGHADTDALLAANAQRETAFLVKIKGVAAPADGLAAVLDAADQSTQGKDKAKDKGKDSGGEGQGGNPKGAPQPQKKK